MIPPPGAPLESFRRAAADAVGDARAHTALCNALPALPPDARAAVLPVLIHRSRGAHRRRALEALRALALREPLSPALAYAAIGELFNGGESAQRVAAEALFEGAGDCRDAIALAVAINARVPQARGITAKLRSAHAQWCAFDGTDPLGGGDARARWRTWLESGSDHPALDHALVLATSGATRAPTAHLRATALHLIDRAGSASEGACALLRWLGAEAACAQELPVGASDPAWTGAAAHAIALTRIAKEGAGPSLMVLARAMADDPFVRTIAAHAVTLCATEAHHGPGEASAALSESVPVMLATMASVSDPDASFTHVLHALLGEDETGALTGSSRWLDPGLRTRIQTLALVRPSLGGRELALRDLSRQGLPAEMRPVLAALARNDPDAKTRRHAAAILNGTNVRETV